MTRRALLAGALAPALCPAQAQVLDDRWQDPARGRTLPWRLRLPGTSGPWPLVLYSHGLGGSREGGEVWGQAWAAAGIAVLHLQHPGSDFETLRRGGVAALYQAASAEQLLERVKDLRHALRRIDELAAAGSGPWIHLRRDALGVAGHSFGAVSTQALAGQRFPVRAELSDPRPKAFVALSPSLPVASSMSPREAFGAVTRPFMVVTGSLDTSPLSRDATAEQRAAVYEGLPPGQRALLWLDGADHMSFGGGRPAAVAGLPTRRPETARQREPAHQAAVAHCSSLWWRWRLLGDEAAQQALARPQALLGPRDRLELG
jgi:predicted dienelactone hydrolase